MVKRVVVRRTVDTFLVTTMTLWYGGFAVTASFVTPPWSSITANHRRQQQQTSGCSCPCRCEQSMCRTPIIQRCSSNMSLPSSFPEEIDPKTTTTTTMSHPDMQHVIMIPWERCLADTVPWRSETALVAARRVWPALYDTFCGSALATDDTVSSTSTSSSSNSNSNNKNLDWLFRKLRAIHHVLDGPAEYGLAVRLILEEQVLDDGRSDGASGKYASLFHPRNNNHNKNRNSNSLSPEQGQRQRPRQYATTTRRGTRPLTVGEITAHWRDDLCDTLRFRYTTSPAAAATTRSADPLQLLESATRNVLLEQLSAVAAVPAPTLIYKDLLLAAYIDHDDHDSTAVTPPNTIVIVTVQYQMDLPFARASLVNAGFSPIVVVDDVSSLLLLSHQPSAQKQLRRQHHVHPIYLLYDKKDETTTLKRLLDYQALTLSTTSRRIVIKCVEASYRRLETYIPLCGDDAHRRNEPNKNASSFSYSPQLSLADWAAHPHDLASALMNPWTETVSQRNVLTTRHQEQPCG